MEDELVGKNLSIIGTSQYTANVNDIVIKQGVSTRLVLRSELVVNEKDAESSVVATLMHQKRHATNDDWQDADSFNLTNLRAGQEVRLRLSAGDTRKLYDALTLQYQIPVGNWYTGQQRRFAVVDVDSSRIVIGREKEIIEGLLEEEGENFWDYIEDLRPGLLEATQIKRQHQTRVEALQMFERRISDDDWSEGEWQSFFETNKWIFGQSLAHQVMIQVESQPVYGGITLSGQGSQRGDFLMATMANAKFTVLVEIKKPRTALVGDRYRNKVHLIGDELIGGVTQLQSNCRTWAIEGSLQAENVAELESSEIYTYQPKGILVVGNTAQLDDRYKRATFELFRRELRNPEILTFDELLERARVIVAVEQSRLS